MDIKEPSFGRREGQISGKSQEPEKQPKRTYNESDLWEKIKAIDNEEASVDSEILRKAALERMIKSLEEQGHTVVRNKKL